MIRWLYYLNRPLLPVGLDSYSRHGRTAKAPSSRGGAPLFGASLGDLCVYRTCCTCSTYLHSARPLPRALPIPSYRIASHGVKAASRYIVRLRLSHEWSREQSSDSDRLHSEKSREIQVSGLATSCCFHAMRLATANWGVEARGEAQA